jgi:shikimate dehydrogenase
MGVHPDDTAVFSLADLRRWEEVTRGREVPVRLAVFGDPVGHSKSPQMHNPALAACGLSMTYTRLHIRAEELDEALALIAAKGFVGCNLTIPHKVAAVGRMARLDDSAKAFGVVNTVRVEAGGLAGFNTDGPGLVRALEAELGCGLRGRRVLLLGAGGGAGRAVALQCAMEGSARLWLANRTPGKLVELSAEVEKILAGAGRVGCVGLGEAELAGVVDEVDLVLQFTALGMAADDPSPLPLHLLRDHHRVYDTVYAGGDTALVRAARARGIPAASGLAMLLHQGALAFEVWFERSAPLEAMRRGLYGG